MYIFFVLLSGHDSEFVESVLKILPAGGSMRSKLMLMLRQVSYEKNPPTFRHIGWFIGILIVAY